MLPLSFACITFDWLLWLHDIWGFINMYQLGYIKMSFPIFSQAFVLVWVRQCVCVCVNALFHNSALCNYVQKGEMASEGGSRPCWPCRPCRPSWPCQIYISTYSLSAFCYSSIEFCFSIPAPLFIQLFAVAIHASQRFNQFLPKKKRENVAKQNSAIL